MAAQRALLSVSDKAGIVEFARELVELGVSIVSTGGTARALTEAGIPVEGVSSVTGFPEMLDGRVKTLHPAVHGGILARRDAPEHMRALAAHSIAPIDIVCVNLYPFARTVADPAVTLDDAIENIDIGGPAMVRSAAKNHGSVTVVVDPGDYAMVAADLRSADGDTTLDTRRRLAAKAYAHTAAYDAEIARFLGGRFRADEKYPEELTVGLRRAQLCRYGENPHQSAAFYRETPSGEPSLASATQLNGKEMSFNNIVDAAAALEAAKEHSDGIAAVVVKHTNPCGAAVAGALAEAIAAARAGDPVSAFGGILAVTRTVDAPAAEAITVQGSFYEVVVAPDYTPEALEMLATRKGWGADVRVLAVGDLDGWRDRATAPDMKRVVGGFLVQDRDLRAVTAGDLTTVTDRAPTAAELADLLFAWRVVRHVKSNAIVFARGGAVVGVGAGQMNRVQSVRIAAGHAGEAAGGAVVASDAFFPFADGPEAAIAAGVTAIIQPGGSKRDADTIEVCNEHGVAMVFTGVRLFRH